VEIARADDALVLSRLDVFFVELLRQIPVSANPGDNESARNRLYSKPGNDQPTNAEWKEFVEPDLRHLFESANETVRRDLEEFAESEEDGLREYSLRVPAPHFEEWLNSLNQARLVLAARFEFSDEELAATELPAFGNPRDLSLFQIHFYGFLQECLVREINRAA